MAFSVVLVVLVVTLGRIVTIFLLRLKIFNHRLHWPARCCEVCSLVVTGRTCLYSLTCPSSDSGFGSTGRIRLRYRDVWGLLANRYQVGAVFGPSVGGLRPVEVPFAVILFCL